MTKYGTVKDEITKEKNKADKNKKSDKVTIPVDKVGGRGVAELEPGAYDLFLHGNDARAARALVHARRLYHLVLVMVMVMLCLLLLVVMVMAVGAGGRLGARAAAAAAAVVMGRALARLHHRRPVHPYHLLFISARNPTPAPITRWHSCASTRFRGTASRRAYHCLHCRRMSHR